MWGSFYYDVPFECSETYKSGFSRTPEWRVGVDASPAWMPGTSGFLKGNNPENKRIKSGFSGNMHADFSFNPSTREGILYRGLYQGIGLGTSTFFSSPLFGTPVSVYAFQGAPIAHFSDRVWLGYEWQFGAAFGWRHFDSQVPDNNAVISTAHMGFLPVIDLEDIHNEKIYINTGYRLGSFKDPQNLMLGIGFRL